MFELAVTTKCLVLVVHLFILAKAVAVFVGEFGIPSLTSIRYSFLFQIRFANHKL